MVGETGGLDTERENIPAGSENPALEQLLGHVPRLTARVRGGRPVHRWLLGLVSLLGGLVFLTGIDWGLPSTEIDPYLFGGGEVWSGAALSEAVGAGTRWSSSQPSNIDVDATEMPAEESWIDLGDEAADRSGVLVRYRLYSHQPDEMTVFQAIRAMDPASGDFDPKMYQYGGGFLYPIAGLLKLGAVLGWIELTPEVGSYLDYPNWFARFYLVARGLVVFFGMLGVLAAYKLGAVLADHKAGVIAALLFVLMPITINMSHEAKPHLPAAVLTMWAVYAAIRYTQRRSAGWFLWLCVLSGLAVGMVPAAWSAVSIVVVAALAGGGSAGRVMGRLAGGVVLALATYLACNPYVAINAFENPDLLLGNMKNTGGMYALGSPLEGAGNVGRLVLEGAGPLLALGAILPLLGMAHRRSLIRVLLLGVPAVLVLGWMVAVGANQPGEFGRFAVFAEIALMLAVAVEISRVLRRNRVAGVVSLLIFAGSTGFFGLRYLQQYRLDSSTSGTRREAAAWVASALADDPGATVGFSREPAPFCVPAMDFSSGSFAYLNPRTTLGEVEDGPDWVISCEDRSPDVGDERGIYVAERVFRAPADWVGEYDTVISWANKPICVWRKQRSRS